jgi:hypothetical protein
VGFSLLKIYIIWFILKAHIHYSIAQLSLHPQLWTEAGIWFCVLNAVVYPFDLSKKIVFFSSALRLRLVYSVFRFLYLGNLRLGWRDWITSAILLVILDNLDISLDVAEDVITDSRNFGLQKHNLFLDELRKLKYFVVFNLEHFVLPNCSLLVHIFIKLLV